MENAKTTRLVAKLLRELLRAEHFEDLASLTETLKERCAQLGIRGQGPRGYCELVERALFMVGSNVLLVGRPVPPRRRFYATSTPNPISAADAQRLVAELRARFGAVPIRTMASLRTGREKDGADA